MMSKSTRSVRNIRLTDISLDFTEAIVEGAVASGIDLELKISGVSVPGRRLKRLLLRFEGVKRLEELWYALNTRVRKSRRAEIHDPWPLELPAPLAVLVERKGSRQTKRFQLALDEPHFQVRSGSAEFQLLSFTCRRLSVTDSRGNVIAGDESAVTAFRKFRRQEFQAMGQVVATAVQSDDYEPLQQLLSAALRKKKSGTQLCADFRRQQKRTSGLSWEQARKSFGAAWRMNVEQCDLADLIPRGVDPDTVVAVVTIAFQGRYACQCVLVAEQGELRLGHYSFDRDWDA